MTLRADTKLLADAVRSAAAAAHDRIVGCEYVVLRVSDGALYASGTDSETWVTHKATIDGDLPLTAVPASLFSRLVANLDGETTELEIKKAKLEIVSGGHRSRVPILADVDKAMAGRAPSAGDACGNWDADQLGRVQALTKFAATDAKRPALQGVHLAGGVATATDGYRVVASAVDWDTEGVVVPASVFKRLPVGETAVSRSPIDIRFQGGDVRVVSRLIEAEYPDVIGKIPQPSQTNTRVWISDTAVWLKALKRMAVHRNDELGFTHVDVNAYPEDGLVVLTIPEVAEETVDVEKVEGADAHVSFNAAQLTDLLSLSTDACFGLVSGRAVSRFDGDGFYGAVAPFIPPQGR